MTLMLPNDAIRNPFSSRYLRPGGVSFLESHPDEIEGLMSGLKHLQGRASILGAHGSGKSTLAHELVRQFRQEGQEFDSIQLTHEHVDSKAVVEQVTSTSSKTAIYVDGFDQLTWIARRKLKRLTERRGQWLLTTSHRRCGLPILVRLQSTPERFGRIVDHLLQSSFHSASSAAGNIGDIERRWREQWSDDRLEDLLEEHGGDMREALFALYDAWETFWRG